MLARIGGPATEERSGRDENSRDVGLPFALLIYRPTKRVFGQLADYEGGREDSSKFDGRSKPLADE